jgi:hypothetical protein
MGIDEIGLETLLLSQTYIQTKKRCLMLGRQQIFQKEDSIKDILERYGFKHLKRSCTTNDFAEQLLHDLGFEEVDSLDYSDFEGATILHDMNKPIHLEKRYDFIIDCGTTEHIFHVPQVFETIQTLLEVGGVFCSVVPNNNMSGHGMYQFSPEFFLSLFTEKYGMELKELYIAINPSPKDTWMNVNHRNGHGSRNCSTFSTEKQIYCIAIAKKISNNRKSLLTESPFQYSYEQVDWKEGMV